MRFCENLRKLRKNRNMSQTDLAKRSGLQPCAISHYECGRRAPSLSNFRELVITLGVPADELLGGAD